MTPPSEIGELSRTVPIFKKKTMELVNDEKGEALQILDFTIEIGGFKVDGLCGFEENIDDFPSSIIGEDNIVYNRVETRILGNFVVFVKNNRAFESTSTIWVYKGKVWQLALQSMVAAVIEFVKYTKHLHAENIWQRRYRNSILMITLSAPYEFRRTLMEFLVWETIATASAKLVRKPLSQIVRETQNNCGTFYFVKKDKLGEHRIDALIAKISKIQSQVVIASEYELLVFRQLSMYDGYKVEEIKEKDDIDIPQHRREKNHKDLIEKAVWKVHRQR